MAYASTLATTYTNASLRVISEHARQRDVEDNQCMRDAAVRGRFRLLNRQSRSTKPGVARQLGWRYYTKVDPDVLARAVEAASHHSSAGGKGSGKKGGAKGKKGYAGHATGRELRKQFEATPMYYCLVRGNDHRLSERRADVVTNFLVGPMGELREGILARLDDCVHSEAETGEDPVTAFRELMCDDSFTQMLRVWYEIGDQKTQRLLHLASRLGAGHCFLHNVIRENAVGLLDMLLREHAPETIAADSSRPVYMTLVEPLITYGKYQINAWARAVYDGRLECLRVLLEYAERHGHDVTCMRNRESEAWQAQHGRTGMTLLEMAEDQENYACYNLLAPYFGVPPRGGAAAGEVVVDKGLREVTHGGFNRPRVVIMTCTASTPWCSTVVYLDNDVHAAAVGAAPSDGGVALWTYVAGEAVEAFTDATEGSGAGEVLVCKVEVSRFCNDTAVDVARAVEVLRALLEAAWAVHARRPVVLDAIAILEVIVADDGYGAADAVRAVRSLYDTMRDTDREMWRFANQCDIAISIYGAPGATRAFALKEAMELVEPRGEGPVGVPLMWSSLMTAATYTPRKGLLLQPSLPLGDPRRGRVQALVRQNTIVRRLLRAVKIACGARAEMAVLNDATRYHGLIEPAEAVMGLFFDTARMLVEMPQAACDAVDPAFAVYAETLLACWFRRWDEKLGWAGFCEAIAGEHAVRDMLAPEAAGRVWEEFRQTVDVGVQTLLRMDMALESAHRRTVERHPGALRGGRQDFAAFVDGLLPRSLRAELPLADAYITKLCRRWGPQAPAADTLKLP